jgi:hypothetical protein
MATAVLGMKGTGSFSADERPKNYREQILLLYPNSAPLLAMTNKLSSRPTDDPEFKIFKKGLPIQRMVQSGGATNVATTINIAAGAGDNGDASVVRAGYTLMNERTFEVFWVTVDPVAPWTAITVVRGKGTVAGTAMNDLDGLLVIGNHNEEGVNVPTAISFAPVVTSNYTQIFRDPINLTRTAENTRIRYGKPKVELKREALEMHGMGIEKAIIWGQKIEATGGGGNPDRTTAGIYSFISTNVYDASAGFTITGWETFLEGVFKNGSTNKALFCGARLMTVANAMARAHTQITAVPTSESYGIQMKRWLTPFGDVMLIVHPLFSNNPTFNSWGILTDMKQITYRYFEGADTHYRPGIQAPSADGTIDEFMTECGLEVGHEQTCGVVKSASTFAP